MSVPPWLKDTRNQGIFSALVVLLVVVLYVTHNVTPTPTITTEKQLIVPSLVFTSSVANTPKNSASSSTPATKVGPPVTLVSASNANTDPASNLQDSNDAAKLTTAGANLLKSMVNIVCVSGVSPIPTISGSGVIIESRGIILTAAHVAQFLLLQDYLGSNNVACLARTGSPARRAYFIEPIYVSPKWLEANPKTITTTNPQGTGENDFALIAITGTATSTPLPNSFPAIPLSQTDPTISERVAIGSYGAQYLTATQLNFDLYPILVFGSIQNRYTYGGNTVDVISIMGSAASQEGSSGGGILNSDGELQGVITTSSIAGSISSRSLNAITIGHIRRSYASDTGLNLDSVLQSNSLETLVGHFASESKLLGQEIVANIGSSSH